MDNKNIRLSPDELWHERHKYSELVSNKYPDFKKKCDLPKMIGLKANNSIK